MSNVSSAIAAYYSEEGKFPPNALSNAAAMKTTLGVAVPAGQKYISTTISVGAGSGLITFQIQGTGESSVDGGNLVLSPTTTTDGAINWIWSGSIPQAYIPKK